MKNIIVSGAVLLAAGCVSNQNALDESFGAAYAVNNAAQIIDPTPAEGAPEASAAAVDLAVTRYKADKVKPPTSGKFRPGEDTAVGQAPQ